jgi:hypothetical protein
MVGHRNSEPQVVAQSKLCQERGKEKVEHHWFLGLFVGKELGCGFHYSLEHQLAFLAHRKLDQSGGDCNKMAIL